jgi:hypothetical protein
MLFKCCVNRRYLDGEVEDHHALGHEDIFVVLGIVVVAGHGSDTDLDHIRDDLDILEDLRAFGQHSVVGDVKLSGLVVELFG